MPEHRHWRKVMFAGGIAVLAWLVVTHSFAAYLANLAPQGALWLNPTEPEALVKLSDEALNGPPDPAPPRAAARGRSPRGAGKPRSKGTPALKPPSQEIEIVRQKPAIDLSKIHQRLVSALA